MRDSGLRKVVSQRGHLKSYTAEAASRVPRQLTVDTLILTLLVYVVKAPQHLDRRHVCAGVVHYTFRTVFH